MLLKNLALSVALVGSASAAALPNAFANAMANPQEATYQCHSYCGNAIIQARELSSDTAALCASDSTFMTLIAQCMPCADTLWSDYGSYLSPYLAQCSIPETPGTWTPPTATAGAATTTSEAAAETTSSTEAPATSTTAAAETTPTTAAAETTSTTAAAETTSSAAATTSSAAVTTSKASSSAAATSSVLKTSVSTASNTSVATVSPSSTVSQVNGAGLVQVSVAAVLAGAVFALF